MQSLGFPKQKRIFSLLQTSSNILYFYIYIASKLQIQSIEPNCGSVLGGSLVKLYMPIANKILDYVENITVGFKNNQEKESDK